MRTKNSPQDLAPNYSFSLSFNPEIFRLIAYIALISILALGLVITKTLVDVPPETTTIYKLFGFNHICNVIDHEPSRTLSSMLWPFWEVPFVLYVVFNFLRIQDAYREGKTPKYTFVVAAIFLPIEVLLTVWVRVIFVRNPEVGFLGHYLPYVGLQLLLFLTAFENALYFYSVEALPFQKSRPALSRPATIGYLGAVFVATFLYILFGMAVALGHPIIDPAHNMAHRAFFRSLASFYSILVIIIPLGLSLFELKRSPDHTLSVS